MLTYISLICLLNFRCYLSIRGQYDDLQGSTDAQRQRQVDFKKWWRGLHLFSDMTTGMIQKWNYAIPPLLLHNL